MKIKDLSGLCRDFGMPAVAVTDTNNLFAALEFSVNSSGSGIQPIIGCQIDVAYKQNDPDNSSPIKAPVVLLAQNKIGYQNLI